MRNSVREGRGVDKVIIGKANSLKSFEKKKKIKQNYLTIKYKHNVAKYYGIFSRGKMNGMLKWNRMLKCN